MNIKSSLMHELRDKEYRESFVASEISIGLPFQIRSLRKSRDLTQPELAEMAGMSQPRISEIETPGARNLSLDTLLRIAAAFDVALQVRFVSFGKLVGDSGSIDLNNFHVPAFAEEIEQLEKIPVRKPSSIFDELYDTQQSRSVVAIGGKTVNTNASQYDDISGQNEGAMYGSLSSIAS